MKFAISLSLLVFSLSAFAQDVSIRIEGRGVHVCSAQAMMTDRPVLARGESKREAQVLALQECQKQGNAFFCNVKECEKDGVNGNLASVDFDVINGQGSIAVAFKGKSKYLCTAEAFSKIYSAKAATKVEARVLAANVCAADRGGDAFFCEAKCEKVSGVSGGIRIGDIFSL